jgi:hypothetical protein
LAWQNAPEFRRQHDRNAIILSDDSYRPDPESLSQRWTISQDIAPHIATLSLRPHVTITPAECESTGSELYKVVTGWHMLEAYIALGQNTVSPL